MPIGRELRFARTLSAPQLRPTTGNHTQSIVTPAMMYLERDERTLWKDIQAYPPLTQVEYEAAVYALRKQNLNGDNCSRGRKLGRPRTPTIIAGPHGACAMTRGATGTGTGKT